MTLDEFINEPGPLHYVNTEFINEGSIYIIPKGRMFPAFLVLHDSKVEMLKTLSTRPLINLREAVLPNDWESEEWKKYKNEILSYYGRMR